MVIWFIGINYCTMKSLFGINFSIKIDSTSKFVFNFLCYFSSKDIPPAPPPIAFSERIEGRKGGRRGRKRNINWSPPAGAPTGARERTLLLEEHDTL